MSDPRQKFKGIIQAAGKQEFGVKFASSGKTNSLRKIAEEGQESIPALERGVMCTSELEKVQANTLQNAIKKVTDTE